MAGATAAVPETEFQVPEIMDWTILPSTVIAEAWTDEEFRARLLADPTSVLRERVTSVPTADKTFVVVQDTDDVKYYALPALKPELRGARREEVLRILDHEIGDSDDLDDDWLPKSVIADALTDPDFKLRLAHSAHEVLRERGFEPSAERVIVLENTRRTYHLVLPRNPSAQDELTFDELNETLLERFGQPTTKCCATGTCD